MPERLLIALALSLVWLLSACQTGAIESPLLATSLATATPINQPEPVVDQNRAMASGDYSSCSVCHGSRLQGNLATAAPPLNHLPDWYIRNQLISFRNGWRGAHPEDAYGNGMYRTAQLMSDQTISNILTYLAELPAYPSKNAMRINNLYSQKCASCHGPEGEGDKSQKSPPLQHTPYWYVETQLKKFREGWRGTEKADLNGTAMAAIATSLTDQEVQELLAAFDGGQ